MKTNASEQIMWAAQHQRVLDTLARDGVYYVKRDYVKQKYRESAWIFETAYSFLTGHAQQLLPRPSSEAENLVWMYKDPAWLAGMGDYRLLKLRIPAESMVLFDRRMWEKIIGLKYIGSPAQEDAFAGELERCGIKGTSELFQTGFYPLQKRSLLKSWEQIMKDEPLEERLWQGGAWCLHKEWILNWDELQDGEAAER